MVKVVEVINFLHELDLLEAHLDEHEHFIDKIVVVESEVTYSGMSKPLIFQDNIERFRKYNVEYEKLPRYLHTPIPGSYPEEERQKWHTIRKNNREAQQAYIFDKYKTQGDYICNSDVDEIWSRQTWYNSVVSRMNEGYLWIAPELKHFTGFLDAVVSGLQGHWRIAKSTAPSHVRQKHMLRGYSNGFAGWHFSNCYKDPKDIWLKGVGIAQSCGYLGWERVPTPDECAELLEQDIDPLTGNKIHSGVVMPIDTLNYLPEFMGRNRELYPWLPERLRAGMQISDWKSPTIITKEYKMLHVIRKTLFDTPKFNTGRWVTDEEAEYLCKLINQYGVSEVYESGTANGYSSCLMSETGVTITTYDPVSRPHIWEEPQFTDYAKNITYVQAGFETMKIEPSLKKRLFFIDGLHDITGCRNDLNTVLKYIKKNDVIVLHDYRERKVAKVINRMNKSEYKLHIEPTARGICVLVKETDTQDEQIV